MIEQSMIEKIKIIKEPVDRVNFNEGQLNYKDPAAKITEVYQDFLDEASEEKLEALETEMNVKIAKAQAEVAEKIRNEYRSKFRDGCAPEWCKSELDRSNEETIHTLFKA